MQGVIDRIEEEVAVIQLREGGEVIFPLDQLPEGSSEGSVVEIVIKSDEKATSQRREAIRRRQEQLKK
ncbi:DUF3006 domain-containing protein [bacterium]|nr:DUF3006 domain-containing protein [bacterium]MCK4437238.1 DUF3006 domain-containing protein [bacterium]